MMYLMGDFSSKIVRFAEDSKGKRIERDASRKQVTLQALLYNEWMTDRSKNCFKEEFKA